MSEKKDTFQFSYSAKQQEEIRKIREKYTPKEESKMERLRKLDESATRPGTIAAVTLGVIGALLLGVGMSCTMVWDTSLFIPIVSLRIPNHFSCSIHRSVRGLHHYFRFAVTIEIEHHKLGVVCTGTYVTSQINTP